MSQKQPTDSLIVHLTRGKLNPRTLDEARALHNAFVSTGAPPAIEIARSLTDLSHTLYAPPVGGRSSVQDDELLFFDWWVDPNAMEQFFANPAAAEAGARLFSSREESEWAQAPSAFSFHVPAPDGTSARYIRMMRAPVRSAEDASTVLGNLARNNLIGCLRRGQLSHDLFVRYPTVVEKRPASNSRFNGVGRVPAVEAPIEILAVDTWTTLQGLQEHYSDAAATAGIADAVAGQPDESIWEAATGFTEW